MGQLLGAIIREGRAVAQTRQGVGREMQADLEDW